VPSNIASRSYLLPRLDLEEGYFNILSGTGGSQPTSALFLMISLYNLYDIENRVFTCRNKYYIDRVNETGPVESLLKLLVLKMIYLFVLKQMVHYELFLPD
jgi:hypothetical protein